MCCLCVVFAACYALFVDRCSLCVVCGLLFAVCCLLFAVCCLFVCLTLLFVICFVGC